MNDDYENIIEDLSQELTTAENNARDLQEKILLIDHSLGVLAGSWKTMINILGGSAAGAVRLAIKDIEQLRAKINETP